MWLRPSVDRYSDMLGFLQEIIYDPKPDLLVCVFYVQLVHVLLRFGFIWINIGVLEYPKN